MSKLRKFLTGWPITIAFLVLLALANFLLQYNASASTNPWIARPIDFIQRLNLIYFLAVGGYWLSRGMLLKEYRRYKAGELNIVEFWEFQRLRMGYVAMVVIGGCVLTAKV